MTLKDIFKKLELFNMEEETEDVLNFMNAKLEDGTILQSDNFEVGQEVLIVNEDGTTEVMTDGSYDITIPEGETDVIKTIVITNGLIETIEVKEVEETPETPEQPVDPIEEMEELVDGVEETPETPDPMVVLIEKITELENRLKVLEEVKEVEVHEIEEPEVEFEKLDGAPIELQKEKIMDVKNMTPQNKFLSKLYND
jgi:hypothetical protein